MTESPGNEPSGALFARIRQLVGARGVDIRHTLSGNTLRLEFADGQRIVINMDAQTRSVWLAARSGGIEFTYHEGVWQANDGSELFARLQEIIEQTISSNPLNARPAGSQPQQADRLPPVVIYYEAKESHLLRNVLIVTLVAAVGFWLAQRPTTPVTTEGGTSMQTRAISVSKPVTAPRCEGNFPANGNITIFPGSGLHADGPNDPLITLQNDHAYPMLLILTVPQTVTPLLSVLVYARQSTSLHLPQGQYDMMFAVGNAWCNPRIGFSDGTTLKFNKPLVVQMDRPVQLVTQSSGAGIGDVQLLVKTTVPEEAIPQPTFAGDGSMEVQRNPNGHFYLPGTIENVPVTFMVDTGASVTSISSDLARQAGIRNCKEVQFQTANGAATGCIALVSRMTLGNFELQNITVAVMPNMETNLLGANVLRNFQVSQSDTTMLIGRR